MADARKAFLGLIACAEALSGARAAVNDVSGLLGAFGILTPEDDRLKHHDSAFCSGVRNLPGGRLACIYSDLGDVYAPLGDCAWHVCHAGIREMCVDMRCGEYLIARVYLGQCRAPGADASRVKRALAGYAAPTDEIERAYMSMPEADEARIEAAARLLEAALRGFVARDINREDAQAFLTARGELLSHKAAVYASRNLERGVRAEDVARALNVSRDALNRAFRRELKLTCAQYITQTRLELACRLLKTTSQSVNAVAVNTGMYVPAYFSRWFRAHTGLSPEAYRRNADAAEAPSSAPEHGFERAVDYAARARELIDARYATINSVGEIARRMHVSPEYLSRLFTRRYGVCLKDALAERRMREARALLVNTDLPVYAISEKTGYKDAAYFARRFRALSGCEPHEYRERNRAR